MWALGVTLYTLIFGENPFIDVDETLKGEIRISRAISDGKCLKKSLPEKSYFYYIDNVLYQYMAKFLYAHSGFSFEIMICFYL